MEVILLAAGKSSRFPNMKPKYLLYDYSGTLMAARAVQKYVAEGHNIIVGIHEDHDVQYNASEFLQKEIPGCHIVRVRGEQHGPAYSAVEIIQKADLDRSDKQILIKDCDNFFEHDDTEGNYVCVSYIQDHDVLKKLSSKSFVQTNDQGIVTNIVEKKVISDKYNVGAYKFDSASQFIDAYLKLKVDGPIYVSHVIEQMISEGEVFTANRVWDYTDVGTAEDWFEYNDKPVIFCDVDGTLIKAQSRYGDYSYYDDPIVLENNHEVIKKYHDNGSMIFFVTSRPIKYAEVTEKMLNNLGYSRFVLLTGLDNAKRILINDYNNANPFPRAEAINIHRDSDNLKDYLK